LIPSWLDAKTWGTWQKQPTWRTRYIYVETCRSAALN